MNIISAEYVKSSALYTQCPPPKLPEYAFIGRSNVGKSSLINMITTKAGLAKISGTPGKTQLLNHFIITSASNKRTKEQWYLVDLPGYGYAKVAQKQRKSWSKMIEDYLISRENLGLLFVLIDSRHEPQKIDLEFIQQLGEWQLPFAIVFTKADKNKPKATERNVKAFLDKVLESWETLPPYFVSSALTTEGKKEILDFIETANTGFKIG